MTRALRITLIGLAFLALGTSRGWAGPVAENQCPGDCSPCLGPSDPFCANSGGGSGSGGSSSNFCVLCESARGSCRDAKQGEAGKDQGCKVMSYENTILSCTAQGNSCHGTSITP